MNATASDPALLREPERPLLGVTVLVPRAAEQAGNLSKRIRSLGGEVVEAPTIEIRPGEREELAAALRAVAVGAYGAICFTSPNAVRAVADALATARLTAQVFGGVSVAAVGPGTAAVLDDVLGIHPDLVPQTSTTAALAAAFPPGSGRVLLPRADIASRTLPNALRAKGYEPVTITAYVTAPPERLPRGVAARLTAGDVDLIAFTSPSTVRNFVALVEGRPWSAGVVSIGPQTSATCAELDIEVTVEADRHDLDGLVAALVRAAVGTSPGGIRPVRSSGERKERRG